MRITLRPTSDYAAAKADLSLSARLALRFIEQGIKSDPDHRRSNRTEYTLHMFGGETVVVEENGDLLVVFHGVGPGVVSLDLVIDRKNPPDWYTAES